MGKEVQGTEIKGRSVGSRYSVLRDVGRRHWEEVVRLNGGNGGSGRVITEGGPSQVRREKERKREWRERTNTDGGGDGLTGEGRMGDDRSNRFDPGVTAVADVFARILFYACENALYFQLSRLSRKLCPVLSSCGPHSAVSSSNPLMSVLSIWSPTGAIIFYIILNDVHYRTTPHFCSAGATPGVRAPAEANLTRVFPSTKLTSLLSLSFYPFSIVVWIVFLRL